METIFDAAKFDSTKRGAAWIEALCGNYVTVEARIHAPEDYFGSLRAAQFGDVGVSETTGAPQVVSRQKHHLRNVEKDCYYLQYLERGQIGLRQHNVELLTDRATLGLYSASEAYSLDCIGTTQGRFIEIPRGALCLATGQTDLPLTQAIDGTSGMGRVLVEFMRAIYDESASIAETERAALGQQLVALVAMAMAGGAPEAGEKRGLRQARLASIKRYIDDNAADPLLDVLRIARDNEISVRYLHRLFEDEERSVSDWLWQRRLEKSFDALTSAGPEVTITEIAFSNGFNSSSHFSAAFKARYGMRPTELRGQRPD